MVEDINNTETATVEIQGHEQLKQMQMPMNDKLLPPPLVLEVEEIPSKTAVTNGICK